MDHLEDVLSNMPVEVTAGNAIVEIKPQVGGLADLLGALPRIFLKFTLQIDCLQSRVHTRNNRR